MGFKGIALHTFRQTPTSFIPLSVSTSCTPGPEPSTRGTVCSGTTAPALNLTLCSPTLVTPDRSLGVSSPPPGPSPAHTQLCCPQLQLPESHLSAKSCFYQKATPLSGDWVVGIRSNPKAYPESEIKVGSLLGPSQNVQFRTHFTPCPLLSFFALFSEGPGCLPSRAPLS